MIVIPDELKPRDGRFGSGPSKVPLAAVRALADEGAAVLGTSHRRPPVRALVGRIRAGLRALFALPDGYEVLLGNGGSTAFWDAAAFGLIRERSAHLVCGEFSAKFADVVAGAPFLAEPAVTRVPYGEGGDAGRRRTGWTSTPGRTTRPPPASSCPCSRVADDALMLVDATSAAGAIPFDVTAVDAYYFAPQKAFGAEAGLWLALVSPAALERIEAVGGSRWQPPSLDLRRAVANSALDQTYNTPAIASLWLLAHQVEWLLEEGGLAWACAALRCARPAGSTPGPRAARWPRRSWPIRPTAARSWPRSTSPRASTPPPWPPPCGPTASSTPSRTGPWAATSSGSASTRPSTPTTSAP